MKTRTGARRPPGDHPEEAEEVPTTTGEKEQGLLPEESLDYYREVLAEISSALASRGTTVEKFMEECSGRHAWEKLQKKKRSREIPEPFPTTKRIHRGARPLDVVLDRGQGITKRAGNWFFQQLISSNKQAYRQSSDRSFKTFTAMNIIQKFVNVGTRFLVIHTEAEMDGSMVYTYRELEYERVLHKTLQAIREGNHNHRFVLRSVLESLGASKSLRKTPAPTTPPAPTPRPWTDENKKQLDDSQVHESIQFAQKVTPATSHGRKYSGSLEESEENSEESPVEEISVFGGGVRKVDRAAMDQCLARRGTTVEHFLSNAIIKNANHLTSVGEMARKEFNKVSRTIKPNANIKKPCAIDVIFERGHCSNQPGNILFRYVVGANQKLYSKIEKQRKNEVAVALMSVFTRLGSRFLEACEGRGCHFRQVDHERVAQKFKQGLREKCLKKYGTSQLVKQAVTTAGTFGVAKKSSVQKSASTARPKSVKPPSTIEIPVKSLVTPDRDPVAPRKTMYSDFVRSVGNEWKQNPVKPSKENQSEPRKRISAELSYSSSDDETSEDFSTKSQEKKDKPKPLCKRALKKQRIEKFLSVGHFTVDFPKERELEDDTRCSLDEVRLALRKASADPTPPQRSTEYLVELYRPSPMRLYKTGIRHPFPLFHSGS